MNRILIIEDCIEMAALVKSAMVDLATVDHAALKAEAVQLISRNHYQMFIVDLNLPDCHGFEILDLIRSNTVYQQTPIIFLTGDCTDSTQITSFNLGAHDFISKPVKLGVLRARLANKLRSNQRDQVILELGPVILNFQGLQARVKLKKFRQSERPNEERSLDLTPIEFKILSCLMRHHNRVMPRKTLNDYVWGERVFVGDRVIDQHVSALRRKMVPYQQMIHTVYGVGYRFNPLN